MRSAIAVGVMVGIEILGTAMAFICRPYYVEQIVVHRFLHHGVELHEPLDRLTAAGIQCWRWRATLQ